MYRYKRYNDTKQAFFFVLLKRMGNGINFHTYITLATSECTYVYMWIDYLLCLHHNNLITISNYSPHICFPYLSYPPTYCSIHPNPSFTLENSALIL